jgi:predicted ribosomally synthesized peptide with SipW-like signal peptide
MSRQFYSERPRRRRFVRLRAVLAGGLVLGMGAVVTVAAWNDPETATGTFSSSRFAIESQTANSSWAAHEPQNPAVLAFDATGMSPSASHYAHIDFRTTTPTSVAGRVTPAAVSNDGGALVAFLEYRMAVTAPATACTAGLFTGSYVAVAGLPTPVPSVALQAGGANVQRVCFDVRIVANAPSSAQGATANITWQFTATSAS